MATISYKYEKLQFLRLKNSTMTNNNAETVKFYAMTWASVSEARGKSCQDDRRV
jgi:hypothetical protein